MPSRQRPFSYAPMFRIMAILIGAIAIAMGWEARSQGFLWNSGYNARIGTETSGSTLSWLMIGGLLIVAGIFPWRRMINRRKR